MKVFQRLFLVATLFSTLFLVQCSCEDDGGTDGPDPVTLTVIEKISSDNETAPGAWNLQSLTKDGTSLGNATGYTLELTQSNGTPGSFTFTPGGDAEVAAIVPAPATSGSWTMQAGDAGINFGSYATTFSGAPSETSMTFTWTDTSDKNEPRYTFTWSR